MAHKVGDIYSPKTEIAQQLDINYTGEYIKKKREYMKNVRVEKEIPGQLIGDIICPSGYQGYYIIGYVRMDESCIQKWIGYGFLSWVEEEKSLKDEVWGYLLDNDVKSELMKNVDLAEGCAQIAREYSIHLVENLTGENCDETISKIVKALSEM